MSVEVFKHVVYLEDWRVLVCLHKKCQCGLTPKYVFRHFRNHHSDTCELSLRQEIERYSKTLDLADPSTLTRSLNKVDQIPSLKLWSGWQCDRCHKCGPIEGGAPEHCKQKHKWTKAQEPMWRPCHVQTVFKGTYQHWFPVQSRAHLMSLELALTDSLEIVLEAAAVKDQNIQSNVIAETINERTESSPWLTRTGWNDMFKGQDMEQLNRSCSTESRDLKEKVLIECVSNLIKSCLIGVKDLNKRGWDSIRFWLRSMSIENRCDKPFRMYYADLQKYIKAWTELLLFCWRTYRLSECGVELTEHETERMEILQEAVAEFTLLDDDAEADIKEELKAHVNDMLLEFIVSLVRHSDFEQTRSAIKYFCGVKGYHLSESRWKTAGEYTPLLAAIQFGIRVFSLEAVLPTSSRSRYEYRTEDEELQMTPLHKFREFHSQYLVSSKGCTLAWAHDLLNYGMKTAQEERGGKIIVDFSNDGRWAMVRGHGFEVASYKYMIQNAVRQAESVLSRELLFRDSDTIELINPYEIPDDDGNSASMFKTDDQGTWLETGTLHHARKTTK